MTRGPWDRTQFLWESAMGKLTFHSWQILYSLKYCSKLGAWSKFTMGRKFTLLAALPKNMRLNSLNRKGPVASKCWGSWQALESSRAGGSQVPRKSQPGLFARVRWMIQCWTEVLLFCSDFPMYGCISHTADTQFLHKSPQFPHLLLASGATQRHLKGATTYIGLVLCSASKDLF